MCSTKADAIAEMLMRMGGTPTNYAEVLGVLRESDHHFDIVSSDKLYEREEIIEATDKFFEVIITLIEEALASNDIARNPHNVGIKATLEGIHEEFDLQYRYLNNRRR
jgi:hypothetical protein